MNIWPPADFCGFGLEHVVPIHSIFEPCPMNENIVRCWWNGHSSSHLPVLEFTDMDHCGLMRLNDAHQILPERRVTLMSKRSSWKRENHYPAVLSLMALSPTRRKCFWPPALFSSRYWTQREEYFGNVPVFPRGTPFSSIHGSTLQMTKLQYVNSSTTIDLQIKNDNR